MIDETILIKKLESIKNNSEKVMNKSRSIKYMSQNQFCFIIDYIIKYINNIKIE